MRQARQLVWLLLSFSLISTAQTRPSPAVDIDTYCKSVTAKVKNGGALLQTCGFALSLKQRLPNFTCDQTLKRFYVAPPDDTNSPWLPRQYDTVTMRVQYEGGRESYSDILRNGAPVTDMASLRGAWSEGEFGTFLRGVFSPESGARFRFSKKTKMKGTNVLVYEYQIEKKKNDFWLLRIWTSSDAEGTERKDSVARPGISGELWVSENESRLLFFKMEATDVDEGFPMQGVKNFVTYAETPMGDGTKFLLPIRSTYVLCPPGRMCRENRMEFSNCHKFGVDTRILPVPESSERSQ